MVYKYTRNLLTIILLLVLINSCSNQSKSEWPAEVKIMCATLYSASIYSPEEFVELLSKPEFEDFSDPEFGVHKYLNEFSVKLLEGALSGPSPNDIHDTAVEIGTNSDAPPHIISRMENDMLKASNDLFTLSMHMRLLSQITKDVASGNSSSYYNSELYNLASIWDLVDASILNQQEIKQIKGLLFAMTMWMVTVYSEAM